VSTNLGALSRNPVVAELVTRIRERVGDRAEIVTAFAEAYIRRMPPAMLRVMSAEELFGEITGAFDFADRRGLQPIAVRAFNPTLASDGYVTPGSVLETNTVDSPFLVDSVGEQLAVHAVGLREVIHPLVGVERDEQGRITAVLPVRDAAVRESVMHFEVDRTLSADELAQLVDAIRMVLVDVRAAVRDFAAMVSQVPAMIEAARDGGSRFAADEIDEAVAFLEWLREDNFVFLGYREYAISDDAVEVVHDSGLGILEDESDSHYANRVALDAIEPHMRSRLVDGDLLVVAKTRRVSTVHRRVRMDYVGVKQVDAAGVVTGEKRMIGLFTRKADAEPAARVPILRRKLHQLLAAEDLIEGSHDYKAAVAIYQSFPKDDLFCAATEDLRREVITLLDLEERRQVKLLVRRDLDDRRVSITVALPRDRFNAELRQRLQELFEQRYNPTTSDYHLSLGESDQARIHFMLHMDGEVPAVSYVELEQEVVGLTRTWDDRLRERLVAQYGEEHGAQLADKYAARFPDYYKSGTDITLALLDVEQFERLDAGEPFTVALQNELAGPTRLTRVGLYKTGGKVQLSDFLPILEALGLRVVEEVPTRLVGGDGETFLHNFGVLGENGEQLDLGDCSARVAGCISAVWTRRAESDSLNRLVVSAGLSWHQVAVLRAYRKFRQLVGATLPIEYQNSAFARHPHVAAKLVGYFELRFDPHRPVVPGAADALRQSIIEDLDQITSLDDDRILRNHLGTVDATVRTNAFRADRDYLSFKFASAAVPLMVKPYPLYEVFVYSPAMEGIHLRGGRVARGGIRWSDRPEDYRTEILGLMKAQMVKNAVIVPVGSKGGFIVKHASSDRAALRREVELQYATLMRGLLDLTDNLADGKIVHPPDVRVLDGDDPYLVVAADKGTATFSDLANSISESYGFWLGDAFASGGSAGYDHKKLAITARGAWESVKRHFRELGVDVMREPFTVVGVGDMSGDVFGNGMLLSDQIRLVAAFDHRHVFIDPTPDEAVGFAERQRLFALPSSSWDDYDRSLISEGGGVWPLDAKSVPLSEQARGVLGITQPSVTPAELKNAILRAEVDLFWNGGIGTFVKASDESHVDVGDRTNDLIRINGAQLRCRVVGEGGNLGFTQRGRIEYATIGGRINTDAIDNSAGVDCSDHEVNLKVLLGIPIAAGDLTRKQRDELLSDVEDDVCRHVLYDNYQQAQILSQETVVSHERLEAYEDLMHRLEQEGLLERAIEFLPTGEEISERRQSGRGISRPELSVLLAYAKRSLKAILVEAPLVDDPYLVRELDGYFPRPVVERFGALVARHPLRRELVATILANDIVNSEGITFVSRLCSETGADAPDVVRAYYIAREVSGAVDRWSVIEALDGTLDPTVQNELMIGIDDLVDDLARWYLHHPTSGGVGQLIGVHHTGFADLETAIGRLGHGPWQDRKAAVASRLVERGVDQQLARRHAWAPELTHAPDIIQVASATNRSIADVADAFWIVGDRLQIDALEDRLLALPGGSRWQRWAALAVEDDLMAVRREAAYRVLTATADASPDEAAEVFLAQRSETFDRLKRLVSTLNADKTAGLDALTVALRHVRGVVA
jgi:glutamate dehydrogenase